jgi:hypothetical protein
MVGALKALGVTLEERWEVGEMVVHGCGGRFPVEVRGSATLLCRPRYSRGLLVFCRIWVEDL